MPFHEMHWKRITASGQSAVVPRSSGHSISNDLVPVMQLLEKLLSTSDVQESCTKDVANLLHANGRTDTAIRFIEELHIPWRLGRTYHEILTHLRAIQGKPVAPISSRVVYVEIPCAMGRITLETLRDLFPNIAKVWRILLNRSGTSALLEFASHSSARRAVDARQQIQTTNNSPDQVKCAWVSPFVHIKPLDLSQLKSFPIIELVDDDSIVCPSTDWRRPRPTSSKQSEAFTSRDLVSVLNMAGAFDDYPAELAQILI
jgi:hypothetical protein